MNKYSPKYAPRPIDRTCWFLANALYKPSYKHPYKPLNRVKR